MTDNNLKKYFKKDINGYYWNEENKCYMLKGVKHQTDKTRNEKAAEQAKMKPISFSKVYSYINEFLEMIRKDNGFEKEIIRIDSIKLGEAEHVIIDNGIIIRDNNWSPSHWDNKNKTYDKYDEKYDSIVKKFKLERVSDILWFKFTNKGHLAVVASSCDINWNYDLSCGTLVNEVGAQFDESFIFVFPLTQDMIRTQAELSSYYRKYTVADLELAVGNYLIDKGVPIIDYFSHMGGKYNMKTLYISDLDGTLLDSTPKTSEYTNATINELLENGAVISFATARSLVTTKKVTKGLNFKYPLVVHNGTFIVDKDGTILHKNIFDKKDSDFILNTVLAENLCPVVFSLIDEKQKFSYVLESANEATKDFLNARIDDPRNREVKSNERLFDGEIYYFTLIGDEKKLEPLYNVFKEKYHCFYQVDMYSGEYWLEILPHKATKANAVKQLANMLGCEKIVAFGDGINDVDMFSIADECYAVENAVDKLKEKATKIIDSNLEDGVAKWLKIRYTKDST